MTETTHTAPAPIPRPEELHVYQYTSTGWAAGEDPETTDDVYAQWEEALRGAGWRPHGWPDSALKSNERSGRHWWEVSGYVVRQVGVQEIVFRAPVPADGGSLADHRRAAITGWEAKVKAEGLEPHGPLRVKWVPGGAYSAPAWEAAGPARPAEDKPEPVGERFEPRGRYLIVELILVGGTYWQGVIPALGMASSPHESIADVVRQVSTFEFPPGVDVHLAVTDRAVAADGERCQRSVWLGRMPAIDPYDCALSRGHGDLCLASVRDVLRQIERAQARAVARTLNAELRDGS